MNFATLPGRPGFPGMNPIKSTVTMAALGALSLAPLSAPASITRQVDKTFVVQPGGSLSVSTEDGDVRVTTGEESVVKITAVEKIRANSEAEADTLLQKLALDLTQNGNAVQAEAKYAGNRSWFPFGSRSPVVVSFVVTVPRDGNVKVRTNGGAITIGDIAGQVDAQSSGGDIRIGRVDGRVRAETGRSDIHLAQASGAVQLRTSGGNIEAGALDGPGDVFSRGGRINIGSSRGGLKAATEEGNLRVRLHGPLTGESALNTTSGKIDVAVEPKAGFALDAQTMSGVVLIGNLDVKVEHGGNGLSRLAGTVNAGGPLLKLHSSSGKIELRGVGAK